MGQLANFSKPIVPICEISELHSISFYVFLLLLLLLFIDDYPRKKFVDLFHRRVRSTNKNGK